MHEKATSVPSNCITAYEAVPKAVLDAARLGLTVEQVFEPGRFSSKQTALDARYLLFVTASDGWCWARITAVTEAGRLVLEREAAPAPDAASVGDAPATRRRAAA